MIIDADTTTSFIDIQGEMVNLHTITKITSQCHKLVTAIEYFHLHGRNAGYIQEVFETKGDCERKFKLLRVHLVRELR